MMTQATRAPEATDRRAYIERIERLLPELIALPQWVAYLMTPSRNRPGKTDKKPINPHTGKLARADDSATWGTFDEAAAHYLSNEQAAGLGFQLGETSEQKSGIVGVDLDNCVDEAGNLAEWAERIIAQLYSYTEISPSGTGIRIFCRGELPEGGRKKGDIEMYDTGRFLTVTGRALPQERAVEERTATLAKLHKDVFGERRAPSNGSGPQAPIVPTNLDEQELLRIARNASNGAYFEQLWQGSTNGYDGDHSAADLAFCNHLAFYTGNDAERIDALFRQSGLMRPKWDERHYANGDTYGERTIAKAIAGTEEVYSGPAAAAEHDESNRSSVPTLNTEEGRATAAVKLGERLPNLDLDFIRECYRREELGDGELFARLYLNRLVYDHSEQGGAGWHFWGGHYWQRDETEQVKLLFSAQVAAQYLGAAATLVKQAGEAKGAGKEEQAESLSALADGMMKRARQLRRVTRMKHALEYAASLLGVTGEVWDTKPLLLPVSNGVISLAAGNIENGKPSDYMRTAAPTLWQGIDARCERWEQFTLEIMGASEEMSRYLQRLEGYGISGLTREAVFPVYWGEEGRNGKDTRLETLAHVLGNLAGPVAKDTVVDAGGRRSSGSAEPHIHDLKGKRLVWASEPKEGARLDAAQVKLITGGGKLKARPLYGQLVEWEPTHLVILVTNPRPHAPADDEALWARIHLVPFNERFVDNPKGPNEHKADKRLKEKLKAEASGILAWLVRGSMAWQREGLNPPKLVRQATLNYREAEDTLGQFIADCCVEHEAATARAGQLVTEYQEWCAEMGIKNPMDGRTFGEKVGARYERGRDSRGKYYQGIGLLADDIPV